MARREKPDTPEASAMYRLHCEGAFGAMGEQLSELRKATVANGEGIAELRGVVINGLSHQVASMNNRLWGIAGVVLVQLVTLVIALLLRVDP